MLYCFMQSIDVVIPRSYGVGVNIIFGVCLRKRTSQTGHCCFGRTVVGGRGAASAIVAGDRADVDDAAKTTALHQWDHGLAHERYTHDMASLWDEG